MLTIKAYAHTTGESASAITGDTVEIQQEVSAPNPGIVAFVVLPSFILTMVMLGGIVWAALHITVQKEKESHGSSSAIV